MSPDESKAQVGRDIPPRLQQEIALAIGEIYQSTFDSTTWRYGTGTGKDLLPYVRRAEIEHFLEALNSRSPGLRAIPSQNHRRTSNFVRVVRSKTVITQSKTPDQQTLPRDAAFRRTLARSPQLGLPTFPLPTDSLPMGDAVYALLTHGHAPNNRRDMTYLQLLILDPLCEQVLARIDLYPYWGEQQPRPEFASVDIEPAIPTLLPAESEEERTSS